jgi:D-alanyl-D-alanine carboxypeptidase
MLPNNIPGVQLVFAYQGDILYDEAFGHSNVEENRAASTSNYHRIASVSKAVTVACLDVLVARGKLNLE